ncbi:MAG: hypothetical protein EOP08_16305, partial [Proteobacteria bacterium]
QVGSAAKDLKVFRFAIDAQSRVSYMDARGDEDNQLPRGTDFEWTVATRENHVLGEHPHVSVYDEVFVETVGGDLTFKVENNTKSGKGIYAEPVENLNQQLADAEIAYARTGGLIVIRVKPLGESVVRFFAYAPEVRKVYRIDEIGLSCVALPEDQGIVFPGGYCLKNGQKRAFDGDVTQMELERVVRSPNGEDTLYVYFRWADGQYVLMPYNAIKKEMAVPIRTNGMSLFPDGRLVVFRAATEATRVHPIQVWRTPFQSEEFAASAPTDGSYLAKVGNRDLVRGISDAISICPRDAERHRDVSRHAVHAAHGPRQPGAAARDAQHRTRPDRHARRPGPRGVRRHQSRLRRAPGHRQRLRALHEEPRGSRHAGRRGAEDHGARAPRDPHRRARGRAHLAERRDHESRHRRPDRADAHPRGPRALVR